MEGGPAEAEGTPGKSRKKSLRPAEYTGRDNGGAGQEVDKNEEYGLVKKEKIGG